MQLGEHDYDRELTDEELEDWLADGTRSAWHPNAPGAMEPPPPAVGSAAGGGGKGSEKPTIVINTDLAMMADELEAALVELGGIYIRGGYLAHIVRDTSAPEWQLRPGGTPTIKPISRDRLRELAGIAADWRRVKRVATEGGETETEFVPCLPLKDACDTLRGRDQWKFPPIEGVVDAPVIRPDGSIFEEPGYDPGTRLFYAPHMDFPAIPREPTRDDAAKAMETLLEPFSDFPFTGTGAIAANVSLTLTAVGRSAIAGCSPMFIVQAPTPGSGKGLLVDSTATIATGRRSPKMTQADDDEMRKRMLALAMSAPQMICLDNISGALYSPALESVLTDGIVHDRILGATRQVSANLRAVWTMTGNNVALKGDLGRRVVPIDLDPGVEHPEDRTGFRHPELLQHLAKRRPELYVAAITVLRAHAVAGRPRHGSSRKGSYEDWDDVIRSAVIWAGGGDPLEDVKQLREEGDVELDNLRSLLISWRKLYGDERQTIAGVVGDVSEKEARYHDGRSSVREALEPYSDRLDSKRLGYSMRRLKGRPVSGLKLVSRRIGGKRWWRVIRIDIESEDVGWEERALQTEAPF